jgi:hypothetical protein
VADDAADVKLELSVRVKDMTAQALARIGKTASDAGKQMATAFKAADVAASRAAGAQVALGRSATTSGDAMRRMAQAQTVVSAATVAAAPQIQKVVFATDRWGTSLERASKSTKGFGTSLGALGGLLRRSPLLLVADLAARVAGFNGVMDIFNKTMNGAADAIRGWIGLAPAHVDATEKEAEAVNKLKDALEGVAAAQRENTFTITNARTGGTGEFNLDGLEGVFRTEALARIAATEASQEFNQSTAETLESFARLRGLLDEVRGRQEGHERALLRAAKATQEAAKAADDWNKALERGAAIKGRREDIEGMAAAAGPLVVLMAQLAAIEAQAAAVRQRRADFADELSTGEGIRRRADAMNKLVAATRPLVQIMRDLAVAQAQEQEAARIFLAQEAERIGKEREVTQFLKDEVERISGEREQSTFGFGFKEVLRDLQDINRFLGSQLAGGTFEGLRTLFRDVATGIKSASDALKDFGRNFVAMIADIFAQKAAAGLITGLFGANFLNGVQSNETGGVMYGAKLGSLPIKQYAQGGIATGPQIAIYGEGKAGQFGEAFVPLSGNRRIPVEMRGGGGGGTVLNATFQVNSLDPSTAASVILSNMHLIGRGLTSMLQSGEDRAFRTAVRTA